LKRSMILTEIKIAGYDGDIKTACLVAAKNHIGKAAYHKAFQDGQKMKTRGDPRPEVAKKK